MSITISIGGEERTLADASEHWITDQLSRRQREGTPVCVVVRVETSGVDLRLTTPACGRGGVGGRQPNSRENEIIQLWNERRLNSNDFTGGSLIAFLKQIGQKL